MSRTLKDAPEWVRANREQVYFDYDHRPFLIGKEYKRNYYVFDSKGDYVVDEYIQRVHLYETYPVNHYRDNGELYYTSFEELVYKEYENHCTCGISVTPRNRKKANGKYDPCTRIHSVAGRSHWYQEQFYDDDYVGNQRKARETLKQVVKKFNTNKKVEEEEDIPETLYQSKRPKNWVH
jgi:hypothetical protein